MILYFIASAKSLVQYEVTQSQILGIGTWTFWEGEDSILPTTPALWAPLLELLK